MRSTFSIRNEILRPFYLLIGIFLISISPLFMSATGFTWPGFGKIQSVVTSLLEPGSLVYVNPISRVERNLFPIIFEAFATSMGVLFLALLFSIVTALVISTGVRMVPGPLAKMVLTLTSVMQSIPDVVYILTAQMAIVWMYVNLDMEIVAFTGAGEQEAYVLPALILSILPTVYLVRSMMELLTQEEGKLYIDLARGKGLKRGWILVVHILRNLFVRLSFQAKFIMSLMVSNLLMVEFLFNNFGMTSFLLSYAQPAVFFVTASLFFIPIYLLMKAVEWTIYFVTKQEVQL